MDVLKIIGLTYIATLGVWIIISTVSLFYALIIKRNIFITQTKFARVLFGVILNTAVTIGLLIMTIVSFANENVTMGIIFLILSLISGVWRFLGGLLTLPFSGVSMICGGIVAKKLDEGKFLDRLEESDRAR